MKTITPKAHPLTAIVILLLLALAPATWAQAVISTSTGGLWGDPATWMNGVVPVSTDDVEIATTGGNIVVLDGSYTVNSITIDPDGQFGLLSDNVNAWELTINGNLNNYGALVLGGGSGPTPTIHFNGTNSLWTGSGDLSSVPGAVVVNSGAALNISQVTNGLTFASAGTVGLTINGSLAAGTNVINGGGAGGAFILASGASLISGNTNGLVNGTLGTIYNFSTTTLPTDANYTFNGAANQITLGLPATVANFTNSNTGGLLALSAGRGHRLRHG